jgi:CheY-like chemotaxis protein
MALFLLERLPMKEHSIRGEGDPAGPIPRILIVDDEGGFLFSASVALRGAGYAVVEAADGKEALSRIREYRSAGKRIDLLLTDLRMPDLCGLELLEGMKELGADIPVIAMTGYVDDALRGELQAEGCVEFLEKPFEPRDLVARVQKVLEGYAYGKGA